MMTRIQKLIMVILYIFTFCAPTSATTCVSVADDQFWGSSTDAQMTQLSSQAGPAQNLGQFLTAIGDLGADFAALCVTMLPPNPPGQNVETGTILGDVNEIKGHVSPASPCLGRAVTDVLYGIPAGTNGINSASIPGAPATSGIIYTDLNTAIAAVNPNPNISLGAAIAAELAFIHSTAIPPLFATSNVIDTDLMTVRGAINPGFDIGTGIRFELDYIRASAIPPLFTTSNIIDTDLQTVKGAINGTSGTIGAAIFAELQFIDTGHLPNPVPSQNVIHTDLVAIRDAIVPAGGNLGFSVGTVSDLIQFPAAASLFAGITNVNNILGAGFATRLLIGPPPNDARTKSQNELNRLNVMSNLGFVIPAATPPAATIEAWLAQFGF